MKINLVKYSYNMQVISFGENIPLQKLSAVQSCDCNYMYMNPTASGNNFITSMYSKIGIILLY